MEHKPLAELQALADVRPFEASTAMPREQRLKRWVDLLEADPEQKLRSLHEIEHLSRSQRRECRADNSPLTVAYDDPVLRSVGLKGDRVGDCMDFFELSDRQMHHAFCSCHVGIRLTAVQAAQRLRRLIRADNIRRSTRAALSRWLGGLLPAR
jgi:hypothetical protein